MKGKPVLLCFDLTIQTGDDVERGVCFSPEKKNQIEHFCETKSPVKIRRFSQNMKYGNRNIVIEKNTYLSVAEILSFKAATIESGNTVASLSKVCHNQTVKITKLYGTKKTSKNNLSKHERYVTDKTGNTKVVFWESFINTATEGKSYEFKNFMYKDDTLGRYISSARQGSTL